MRSSIRSIAVLDQQGKVHGVEFTEGLNVITGKSSTGKSAMIEIFDYCFGSTDSTIPTGIITDNALLYFSILSHEDGFLVLARDPESGRGFIKFESKEPDVEILNEQYFNSKYFIPLIDFKSQLGHFFRIDIEDTDEDEDVREIRGKKNPKPSIRSFSSFMLQHQNLVASKHSLFYRFDQKEKRDQTIEQFKIFAGFVDQNYYLKKQRLKYLEKELKRIDNETILYSKTNHEYASRLNRLHSEYQSITGTQLFDVDPKFLIENPAVHLDKINERQAEIEIQAEFYSERLRFLKEKRNNFIAQKRRLTTKLGDVKSSIDFAVEYKTGFESIAIINSAKVPVSKCPFCETPNDLVWSEVNSLKNAIGWLNQELERTPFTLGSFETSQFSIEKDLEKVDQELDQNKAELSEIDGITESLEENVPLEQQGLKAKLKIENLLEERIHESEKLDDSKHRLVKQEIDQIKKELETKYNVKNKLSKAEQFIRSAMNEFGSNMEFEDSFKPINLNFSLETFDLWHLRKSQKVYLRSLGSGANWLNSHLALFTALHKYFCYLGDDCVIPPILFLDQPSQVYFPSSVDTGTEFDPQRLKELEGKKERVDEDLKAVTNIYNQLYTFCEQTFQETGLKPQIIVTDHADNLQMSNEVEFENLVNKRRWRERGFIQLNGKGDKLITQETLQI